MTITHLGLVAGTITSAAIIPQIVRAYRTKKVRDISIWQPVLLNIGMALWLSYGIILHDQPLIYANAFSLACNSLLILMKFCYREDDKLPATAYIYEQTTETEEL